MKEIDKEGSRKWRARLQEVLNTVWDPIGGCPEDEYEGYTGKIASMIRAEASDEELLDYLMWAEVEHIGLPPDKVRAIKVITALRAVGSPP